MTRVLKILMGGQGRIVANLMDGRGRTMGTIEAVAFHMTAAAWVWTRSSVSETWHVSFPGRGQSGKVLAGGGGGGNVSGHSQICVNVRILQQLHGAVQPRLPLLFEM